MSKIWTSLTARVLKQKQIERSKSLSAAMVDINQCLCDVLRITDIHSWLGNSQSDLNLLLLAKCN